MNAAQMIAKLEKIEISPEYAPDCRRVLRDERLALVGYARGLDKRLLSTAMDESRRVAKMWGVTL